MPRHTRNTRRVKKQRGGDFVPLKGNYKTSNNTQKVNSNLKQSTLNRQRKQAAEIATEDLLNTYEKYALPEDPTVDNFVTIFNETFHAWNLDRNFTAHDSIDNKVFIILIKYLAALHNTRINKSLPSMFDEVMKHPNLTGGKLRGGMRAWLNIHFPIVLRTTKLFNYNDTLWNILGSQEIFNRLVSENMYYKTTQ
jgi:hypothetical protein